MDFLTALGEDRNFYQLPDIGSAIAEVDYDAHQVFGYVPRRGGGKITHSWVEIDIDGATYVFDLDFQYATGKNGFMIHYGMSGTWMYMEYGRIN